MGVWVYGSKEFTPRVRIPYTNTPILGLRIVAEATDKHGMPNTEP